MFPYPVENKAQDHWVWSQEEKQVTDEWYTWKCAEKNIKLHIENIPNVKRERYIKKELNII